MLTKSETAIVVKALKAQRAELLDWAHATREDDGVLFKKGAPGRFQAKAVVLGALISKLSKGK